jgi:hypothetical protein
MDGEYAKVPDPHEHKSPEKHIGLREYDNSVLIHNWFEERNKVGEFFPKCLKYRPIKLKISVIKV